MKTALLKRLKRLEEVRAVGSQPLVELQVGYIKRLPHEYTYERHVVTVSALLKLGFWEIRPAGDLNGMVKESKHWRGKVA